MGQYHKIVNLDKKQYLYPRYFGDGLKLMEFATSSNGILAGLAILLARDNGLGVGDLRSRESCVGSWAGDRIAIVGDYGEPHIYHECDDDRSDYANVSDLALSAMADDPYVAEHLKENLLFRSGKLPDAINKKLAAAKMAHGVEPPVVSLARAVLRAPTDTKLWSVFLDAAMEAAGRQ